MIHLHVHSIYSLRDGLASPEALANAALERKMKACALTDHNSITGTLRFARACQSVGIRPLLGVEAYFVDDVTVRDPQEEVYHLVLLVKDDLGWRSLCNLLTKAHEYFYRKARIDLHLLEKTQGLICLTACMRGPLKHPKYKKVISRLHKHFGDDLYLEIMPVDHPDQVLINTRAVEISEKNKIPLVVTNDVHYLNEEDSCFHNLLMRITTGGRFGFDLTGFSLRTQAEMVAACGEVLSPYMATDYWKKAIENTHEVANKINFFPSKKPVSLPKVVDGDSDIVLSGLANEALKKKLEEFPDVDTQIRYMERLNYELSVIKTRKVADYFLVVLDLVKWAKSQDMELGPGRGSVGGSLLCYLLGIIEVDPIENNLFFERFLSPERTDLPDIDLDFPRSKRQDVLDYLTAKYGSKNVANINTLSELKLKSAFKDVCKQLEVPYEYSNHISSLFKGYDTLREEIDDSEEIRRAVAALPKDIVKYTDGIIGTLRHESLHAAGFVISPTAIEDSGVLEKRKDAHCVCWGMEDVEYNGWLKIDVLALRTLDVIKTAKDLIWKKHGLKIEWREINVHDEELFHEFGLGHTIGLFQFESTAMTGLCARLHPISSFDTLVDINALGRPGPLESGMTEDYVNNYQMLKERGAYLPPMRDYWKWVGPLVEDTLHVIIYQEQIMKIATDVAGFSAPQSDEMRRVIAKSKGKEIFEEMRESFLMGCKSYSGMDEKSAKRLFEDLSKYSRYSFNKSHATAYTELALREIWLKKHYPTEFMAALYAWTDSTEKRDMFLVECRRLGIEIKLPDINLSDKTVSVDGDSIIIGFDAIKGVGEVAVEAILNHRDSVGYDSLENFRMEIPSRSLNKTALKALILAGAFDMLGVNRKVASENLELLSELISPKAAALGDERFDLFYQPEGDFTDSEKEILQTKMIPGVYNVSALPKLYPMISAKNLKELREEVADCRACFLRDIYDNPVAWESGEKPKVFIIAEAPGADEVKEGRPLIGKAGQLLFEDLARIGIRRRQCYITNVFKCRPRDNKLPDPPPTECYRFLEKELVTLQPGLVIAFGNSVVRFFRKKSGGIQTLSGSITTEMVSDSFVVPVLWCIHPAAVLRGGVNLKKRDYGEKGPYWLRAMDQIKKIWEERDE